MDETREDNNIENQSDYRILLSIELKNNKCYVIYENKKASIHYREMSEIKKLRLFKSLGEKIKIVSKRNEYGISLRTALRADSNVLSVLSDERLKSDYKETYLKALEGDIALPFKIEYDKKNRYARALEAGQKRLELQAGYERADEEVKDYDEIFGEGFDQRESVANITKEILHGIDRDGEESIKPSIDERE